jgi:predicted DNA-binding protein (MmcQ/YjbR family)
MHLPEVTEVEAWGEPTFRVGKMFAMYAGKGHHGAGRESVWLKSKHFSQDLLVHGMPERYFVPPYVGTGGWIGVYLDSETDWVALEELVRDAYLLTAKRSQAKQLKD